MAFEQAVVFFAVFAFFFLRFLAEEERKEDLEHAHRHGIGSAECA